MPNHREKKAQLSAWPTVNVISRRVMRSTEEGKLLIAFGRVLRRHEGHEKRCREVETAGNV